MFYNVILKFEHLISTRVVSMFTNINMKNIYNIIILFKKTADILLVIYLNLNLTSIIHTRCLDVL